MNTPPPEAPPAPPRRYLPLPVVKPRLTFLLLAINILVFLAQSATGPDLWFYLGAKVNEFIIAGEWWRLITPMFLHADILHIAFNSYALYIFGPQVEALFGYRRFILIYLLSGISGSVFSFIFSPGASVGASGAIFGLVGAQLIYFYRHRKLFGEMGRRRLIDVAVVAGLNLLIGMRPGVDNWGHIGGLIGGAMLAWLIGPIFVIRLEPVTGSAFAADANPFNLQRWLAVFAVALALIAATAVTVSLQQ
ncbi:MAG: rhomboid family intramembrane serine protease [Chloroflexi bacterium]|nr:rhomboid family intramembrane serine protease [Chloroflexota bacterium]